MQDNAGFVPLSKLAGFEMGQSPSSSFVNDTGEGIPFLQGCAEFGALTPDANFYCSRPLKLSAPNDVLISVRAPVGAVNKSDRTYCIGRGVAAIRFNQNVLPDFGWHLLSYWAKNLRLVAQGTTFEAVNKSDLQSLQVFYLPKWEQRRIAEILDTVDTAIRQTDALISKLRWIKAGLMHDLLTRGLDPQGNLRDLEGHPEQFMDSELGRIPKAWKTLTINECLRTGLLIDVQDGNHGESHPKTSDFVSEGIPFVMANNLVNGQIDVQSCHKITWQQYKTLRVGFARPGDVLLSHKGTIGLTAIVPPHLEHLMLTPQVTYYRTPKNGKLQSRFLLWYFRSSFFQKKLQILSAQSTRSYIGITLQKTLCIPLLHEDEQEAIASKLDAQDALIYAEEATRDKLKAIKQGLMQDLLTGRVRVADASLTTGAK